MNLLELFITHVEKIGPLLKICGQTDQHSAQFVERQILDNGKSFELDKAGLPNSPKDLYPGLVCCARYKDEKYYRASVKDLSLISQGVIIVYFVDYGNTDIIHFSDIRLLEGQKLSMLKTLDPLVSEFFLASVRPIVAVEWDDKIISYVEESIRYATHQCRVVREVIGKKLISIKWADSDFSTHLIQKQLALPVDLETQEVFVQTGAGVRPKRLNVPPPTNVAPLMVRPPVMVQPTVRPGSTVQHRSIMPVHNVMMAAPPGIQQKVPSGMRKSTVQKPAPVPKPVPVQKHIQQFACELLKENTEHSVFVSYVEDGPLSFAVQLKSVVEHDLVDMMSKLSKITPVPKCAPLMPGVICLGRFSGDGSLCRAVVMHVGEDKCRVYYPDYGNSEILPISHIFELPTEFANIKLMASRFTLAGSKLLNLTPELKMMFKDIVSGKELLLRVTPMEENRTKQYCDLFCDGLNVRDMLDMFVRKQLLAAAMATDYTRVALPTRGSSVGVIVSYVESVTKIHVQLETHKETLETLMDLVQAHCAEHPQGTYTPDRLRRGMQVCAYYHGDARWYRAQVCEWTDTDVTVFFVDYGNKDLVPLEYVRYISPDLINRINTQALECCLAGFETSEPDQDMAEKLFDLIADKTLTMKVLSILGDEVLIVELYNERNQNIADFLRPPPAVSPPPQLQSAASARHVSPTTSPRSNADGWNSDGSGDQGKKISPRMPELRTREIRAGSGSCDDKTEDTTTFRKPWNDKKEAGGGFRGKDNNEERGGGRKPRNSDSNEGGRGGQRFHSDSDNRSKLSRENDDGWSSKRRDRDDEKVGGRSGGGRDRDDNRGGEGGGGGRFGTRDGGGFGNDRLNKSGGGNWRERGDGEGHNRERNFNDSGFRSGEGSKRFDKSHGDSWDSKPSGVGAFRGDRNDHWDNKQKGGGDFGGDRNASWDNKPKGGGGFGRDRNDSWDNKPRGGGGSRGGDRGGRGGFRESRGFQGQRFEKQKDFGASFSPPSATSTPRKLTVPNPSIKLGDKERVEIVYSLNPAELFVQATKQKDELIQLMANIADTYTTGGTMLKSPEKGDYCIAQYTEDEVWYRGLIQETVGSTASVLFIDYGNQEEVSTEKLKAITPDLCILPAQAVRCTLIGAAPDIDGNGSWSDEEIAELALVTDEKTLEAHFLNKVFTTNSYQITLKDVTNPAEGECIINHLFGATDEMLLAVLPPPKDTAIKFNPYPVMPGQTLEVQVTWFTSPNQFFVQPLITNPEFRQMMEHIQDNAKNLKLISEHDQQAGNSVIARFKLDKVLYRAEIRIDESESNKTVYFVDYGNVEKIDGSHVWNLELEYSVMPAQAIECRLSGVAPAAGESAEWPKDVETHFCAEKYVCTFLNVAEEDGKFVVSLEEEGKGSVAELLISNGLAVPHGSAAFITNDESKFAPVQLNLLIGQIVRAHVIQVDDSSRMFVQLQLAQAASVAEEIAVWTPKNQPSVLAKEKAEKAGTLCLVNLEGPGWQRACISEYENEVGARVRLIDYGGSVQISEDKVFELADTLSIVPWQAFEFVFFMGETSDVDKLKETCEKKDVLLYIQDVTLPNRLDGVVYKLEGEMLSKPLLNEEKEDVNVPEKVSVICEMPIFQKRQRMVVSHAGKDEVFLQKAEELERLTSLLDEMCQFYEDFGKNNSTELTLGTVYAGRSVADDQWYRSRVLHVEEDSVNVRFIDYGNTELLTADRMIKLDAKFSEHSAFAVKVKLPVEWSVGEENLLELIQEEEFDTEFARSEEEWYVEMTDDKGKRLVERLVELGFATEMDNSPFTKPESSRSKLRPGEKFSVSRMNVTSPSQFWLILTEDFEKLESLQDSLQTCADTMMSVSSKSPHAQTNMLAAKFSDGIWYRALYQHSTDTVFSVDYGNTELFSGELKQLPEEFLESDGYAVECALNVQPASGSSDWDPEVATLFDEMIPVDDVIAHVLKIGRRVLVDLSVNEESVTDSLIEKGHAVPSNSLAYVSHVVSPSDFYLQEESELLDQIREHLTLTDAFTEISDITSYKDSIFAAEYNDDGLWYRAKYIESSDEGTHVLFVDYGNQDVVAQCKELPKELLDIPFMAKHSTLQLPEGVEKWSEVACEKFVELVADGSTLFEVKVVNKDEPAVVDLLLEGQSVTEKLQLTSVSTIEEEEEQTGGDVESGKVFVSHVNSPADFWVQEEDAPLEDMAGKLLDAGNWDDLADAKENSLVAALFDDERWYRAHILNKTEESTNVLFVDYGNSGPALEIRQLPEELQEAPHLAKHCSLKLPSDVAEWSPGATSEFTEITDAVPLDIIFLTTEDDPKVVELYVDGQNIVERLIQCCKSNKTMEEDEQGSVEKPTIDSTVLLGYVNTPCDFFVLFDRSKVEEMAVCMLKANEFEACGQDVEPGSLVAACFLDDKRWYRATIVKKIPDSDGGYEVRSIDFGNVATAVDIKALPESLAEIPPLAVSCSLDVDEALILDWNEANERFTKITADGGAEGFGFKFINEETSPRVIDLLLEERSVTKDLLQALNIAPPGSREVGDANRDEVTLAGVDTEINFEEENGISYELDSEKGDEENKDSTDVDEESITVDKVVNTTDGVDGKVTDKETDLESRITTKVDVQKNETCDNNDGVDENQVGPEKETAAADNRASVEEHVEKKDDEKEDSVDDKIISGTDADKIISNNVGHKDKPKEIISYSDTQKGEEKYVKIKSQEEKVTSSDQITGEILLENTEETKTSDDIVSRKTKTDIEKEKVVSNDKMTNDSEENKAKELSSNDNITSETQKGKAEGPVQDEIIKDCCSINSDSKESDPDTSENDQNKVYEFDVNGPSKSTKSKADGAIQDKDGTSAVAYNSAEHENSHVLELHKQNKNSEPLFLHDKVSKTHSSSDTIGEVKIVPGPISSGISLDVTDTETMEEDKK